jgi:hypothetical protein
MSGIIFVADDGTEVPVPEDLLVKLEYLHGLWESTGGTDTFRFAFNLPYPTTADDLRRIVDFHTNPDTALDGMDSQRLFYMFKRADYLGYYKLIAEVCNKMYLDIHNMTEDEIVHYFGQDTPPTREEELEVRQKFPDPWTKLPSEFVDEMKQYDWAAKFTE